MDYVNGNTCDVPYVLFVHKVMIGKRFRHWRQCCRYFRKKAKLSGQFTTNWFAFQGIVKYSERPFDMIMKPSLLEMQWDEIGPIDYDGKIWQAVVIRNLTGGLSSSSLFLTSHLIERLTQIYS